jgi:hypothetical protein
VLHAIDDSYLPRGMYVDAAFPAMAGPSALAVRIGEVDMLRFPNPVGHAFIKLFSGGGEVASNGAFVVRTDGLRFRETGTPGWRVAYGAGIGYRFETAPSAASEYRLRLDLVGAMARPVVGAPRAVLTVPATRPPLGLFRLPEGEHGTLPPGPSNALVAAATLAEFEANPLARYFFDPAAQTVRFTADERWVLIRP